MDFQAASVSFAPFFLMFLAVVGDVEMQAAFGSDK